MGVSTLPQARGCLAITIPKPLVYLPDFPRRLQFRCGSNLIRQILQEHEGGTNSFEGSLEAFRSAAECLLKIVVAVVASQPTVKGGIEITDKVVDQECLVVSRRRR